jgi:hypothetical protein
MIKILDVKISSGLILENTGDRSDPARGKVAIRQYQEIRKNRTSFLFVALTKKPDEGH